MKFFNSCRCHYYHCLSFREMRISRILFDKRGTLSEENQSIAKEWLKNLNSLEISNNYLSYSFTKSSGSGTYICSL